MTKILHLKISLIDSNPLIWRRLQVTDDYRFDRFHQVLQIIMGWTNSHLHEFHIKGREIGMPDDDYKYEFPNLENETGIYLRKLKLAKGDQFTYLYDFGDHWEHQLEVEQVFEGTLASPSCISGQYACPPEDCGSISGFLNLVEIIKQPDHPEYEEYVQWLPDGYDPTVYDIQSVNAELLKFATWHHKYPRKKSTPWHQI